MWMFKSFSGKEHIGLEGRTIDVGNVKVQVSSAIAEGGFSCVYAAHDAMHASKQYALKHIICNDEESLDLIMREILVMSKLKGHPNVVTLVAHAMLDTGQRKEALLLMEFCGKSLVTVLESRGDEYFEEKNILLIFRDVCSAVCAMHCQSPPIAHRDLKAENILLGADGVWKLCDFGSTSTNHKRFDKPEEMGVEEDNIRKHTTPAYRAPEMWDLFRREVINEKVDIWALGCLLYKICYFKLAFDGDSKLQILNGNYRIPDFPKYNTSTLNLIKDMLASSPNIRPDIMQVWSRVNKLLPMKLRRHSPDDCEAVGKVRLDPSYSHNEGLPIKTSSIPQKSSLSPSLSREQVRDISTNFDIDTCHPKDPWGVPKVDGAPIGAFWSTSHAKDSEVANTRPCNVNTIKQSTSKHNQVNHGNKVSPRKHAQSGLSLRWNERNAMNKSDADKTKGTQINFVQDAKAANELSHANKPTFENKSLNTLVAELDKQKLGLMKIRDNNGINNSVRNESELYVLKEQLRQANSEKADIASKYEKLSVICRSQRQEIQELKHALSAATRSLPKDSSRSQVLPTNSIVPDMQIEGTIWELQQGMMTNSSSAGQEPQPWHAFESEPNVQSAQGSHQPFTSTGTTNGGHCITSIVGSSRDACGNNLDGLTKTSTTTSSLGNTSQRSNGMSTKKVEGNQPSAWAGF